MLVFAPIFLPSCQDKKNADFSLCCPQSQPCVSLSDRKSSWILEANRGKRWVDSNSNEVTCQQSGARRQGQKITVERCSERPAQQPQTSMSLHEAKAFIRMQSLPRAKEDNKRSQLAKRELKLCIVSCEHDINLESPGKRRIRSQKLLND